MLLNTVKISTKSFSVNQKFILGNYVPPPKVRGDILVSVRNPGVGVGVTSLCPPYFLNQWVEFYHTCMDTLLGQAKELIKFW